MAQNPHALPPSKRFKILSSNPIPRPPVTTSKDNQKSLPAKKRSEVFNISPTSACLPANKGTEMLNYSSSSACIPAKKRAEILSRSSTSAFLPFKKRDESLNTCPTTTVCLPAKKRVWVPHPLSPIKTETHAQQTESVVEEKVQIKDEDASNGVPVKKRAWARFLLSPTKTETQVSDTEPKSADVGVETSGGEESTQLPAKKRVWIDLNSVQESDQINDGKEDIVLASNPLPVIEEVTVKKGVVIEHSLTPPLLRFPEEAANQETIKQKDPIDDKKVKEINGGKKRVLAPNPFSAAQEVTEKQHLEMEHLLTPAFLELEKKAMNTKPLQENHQIKAKEVKGTDVPAKKKVSAQNPSSAKKRVWRDNEQDKENHGLVPKKRVWAPNPSSVTKMQTQAESDPKYAKEKGYGFKVGKVIQEPTPKKKVHIPLSPIAEEKDQTEYLSKRAKEIGPVLAKRRVWAPEPSASTTNQIKQCTDPKPVKLRAENELQIKDSDDFYGIPVHPLSPAKTETENKEKGPESIEEEVDDGVLCAVCQSTDGEPSDPIVFCDGCDLMVHASCYGNPLIKSIPEGDWFCSVCSSKSSKKERRCCLCPSRGGALKPTVDGKWAHVMCALLVPEVFFQDSEGRDGIDCSRVPHTRWQKDCFICGRNTGCAIDCAESKCKLGFHVSCGLEEGLCIEYKEGKEGKDIVAGFCTEHTKLWQKQQLTGKFRIVSSAQDTKRKTD